VATPINISKIIANVVEEAVAEKLSPCLQQFYFDEVMKQIMHLVFILTPVANLVTAEFVCEHDLLILMLAIST